MDVLDLKFFALLYNLFQNIGWRVWYQIDFRFSAISLLFVFPVFREKEYPIMIQQKMIGNRNQSKIGNTISPTRDWQRKETHVTKPTQKQKKNPHFCRLIKLTFNLNYLSISKLLTTESSFSETYKQKIIIYVLEHLSKGRKH